MYRQHKPTTASRQSQTSSPTIAWTVLALTLPTNLLAAHPTPPHRLPSHLLDSRLHMPSNTPHLLHLSAAVLVNSVLRTKQCNRLHTVVMS